MGMIDKNNSDFYLQELHKVNESILIRCESKTGFSNYLSKNEELKNLIIANVNGFLKEMEFFVSDKDLSRYKIQIQQGHYLKEQDFDKAGNYKDVEEGVCHGMTEAWLDRFHRGKKDFTKSKKGEFDKSKVLTRINKKFKDSFIPKQREYNLRAGKFESDHNFEAEVDLLSSAEKVDFGRSKHLEIQELEEQLDDTLCEIIEREEGTLLENKLLPEFAKKLCEVSTKIAAKKLEMGKPLYYVEAEELVNSLLGNMASEQERDKSEKGEIGNLGFLLRIGEEKEREPGKGLSGHAVGITLEHIGDDHDVLRFLDPNLGEFCFDINAKNDDPLGDFIAFFDTWRRKTTALGTMLSDTMTLSRYIPKTQAASSEEETQEGSDITQETSSGEEAQKGPNTIQEDSSEEI